MNAKKCDRCKRYYDMPSFEQGVAVYANETGWKGGKELDLCDECTEKLVRWLKNEVEE